MILHIGFPKTGTTSFQSEISNSSGNRYLGKRLVTTKGFVNTKKLSAITNYVRQSSRIYPPPKGFRGRLENSMSRTYLQALRATGNWDSFIYSDEDISLARRKVDGKAQQLAVPTFAAPWHHQQEPCPQTTAEALEAVCSRLHVTQILLTIRKQWELIPSLYAERSRQNVEASQNDFELSVRSILASHAWLFDFLFWVEMAENACSSVSVVRLEDPTPFEIGGITVTKTDSLNALKHGSGWRLRRDENKSVELPPDIEGDIRSAYTESNRVLHENLKLKNVFGYF